MDFASGTVSMDIKDEGSDFFDGTVSACRNYTENTDSHGVPSSILQGVH